VKAGAYAAGEGRERRSTRQLEATYRALCERDDHPSAEQVYASVRAALPSTSRGTVYRNLQKLVEDERIRVVPVAGRSARYDGRVEPHDHFVCTACGDLVDVHRADAPVAKPPRGLGGHRIEAVAVTYFGLCRGCRPATSPRAMD